MTWKRVATAAVLMPVVIGLVVWGSTTVVAVAVAILTTVALWEYFGLGEAIGHRGYRVWTVLSAAVLVFAQVQTARPDRFGLEEILRGGPRIEPSVGAVFFVFVLGLMALTLWTRRPLVEALPAAGIS